MLAEASWPLFLVLQFRQSDLTAKWVIGWCTNSCFQKLPCHMRQLPDLSNISKPSAPCMDTGCDRMQSVCPCGARGWLPCIGYRYQYQEARSTRLKPPSDAFFNHFMRSLFADVMREAGCPAPLPLPVSERQDIEHAAPARRRQRAAAMTGAAAPCTAPAQVMQVSRITHSDGNHVFLPLLQGASASAATVGRSAVDSCKWLSAYLQ